jgi:hypothetical protein
MTALTSTKCPFWVGLSHSPDGHPKLLHLWPVKLLQAGQPDYDDSVLLTMRAAASLSR